MNSMTHSVAPEEIMALVDGELTAAEASAVAAHIEECAECAALRDELRGTSEALHAWTAQELSAKTVRAVEEKIERADAKNREMKPRSYTPLSLRNWRLWAIGGGGALAGAAVLIAVVAIAIYWSEPQRKTVYEMSSLAEPEQGKDFSKLGDVQSAVRPAARHGGGGDYRSAPEPAARGDRFAGAITAKEPPKGKLPQMEGMIDGVAPPPPVPDSTAPMIARSVAITVLVKNIEAARRDLDRNLGKHGGYAAQLTVNTPENGARSFQSSLRIPAGELGTALNELRSLGRVQTETQSGEEVTQQHTDLMARLTNARETETRLRAILQQRAGKMEDVLEVEEKIAETRGEIEQMEAEQKALEHRVSFASVELQLTEQYKAQLDGAPASVGTEMHNALVAGLRNAGGSLLGLVLFFEEYGPALVLWTVILGGPVWLVWRIRRRKNGGQ
jgi:Domain of unknown function (DUF4349)/Putative zinc-finger